jgi:hypothetical protein
MEWRHYEVRQSGDCQVSDGDVNRLVCCELGIVETGRTRVFAGYFLRVRLGGDEQITVEDDESMIAALWRLVRNLTARGLRLQCAGMSPQWRESGLSQNTGWGYYGPHQQPMHLMDDMPEDGGDETLDRVIREAVDGIRIGMA